MIRKSRVIGWNDCTIYLCKKNYTGCVSGILSRVRKTNIGQPIIDSGYISISHTKKYDVYAINTISPIGVDIEPIKRKLNDVVNIDNMKRWTIKEAVIKTLGARSIKDVNNVSIISDSVAIFNNRKYNYKVLKLYGHFITICVTDNIK